DHTAKQHWIGADQWNLAEVELGFDFAGSLRELALKELDYAADHLVQINWLKLRCRHFGKVAEAPDDRLQIGDFGQQRRCAFAKDFVELFGSVFTRAQQVFDGNLQRKERVLEFMGKPPGQFPPCRHALGLHQTLALRHQLFRHVIERRCQFADLVARRRFHAHIPVALADFRCSFRQISNGPADTGGENRAYQHAEKYTQAGDYQADIADMFFQGQLLLQRVADKQDRRDAVGGITGQRDRMNNLLLLQSRPPIDGHGSLMLLHRLLDQRHDLVEAGAIFCGPKNFTLSLFWRAVNRDAQSCRW